MEGGNRSAAEGLTGLATLICHLTDDSAPFATESYGAGFHCRRCIDGAHQASKAKDDGLVDTHFAHGR